MRWVRFLGSDGPSYGILHGKEIEPVAGSPLGQYRAGGQPVRLSDAKLLPPVIPPTFYAAGVNYVAHIEEASALLGRKIPIPSKPDIGYRAVNALIAHDEPIIIPADAQKVQPEGELVVVIGRQAKGLDEAEALSCVFGYSIGNDVSERTWQAEDRTLWRAKNTDTFKPMGPWIETEVDLDALVTVLRVNGKETARFATTGAMLFPLAKWISAMTRYVTLQPGDVIWMGTDGAAPDLKAGDVVEVEIDGIGCLRNPVKRAG